MKRNIFQRMNQCQIYQHIFYGYVSGRQESGDEASIAKMAVEFLDKYRIDDIEDKILIIGYYNYYERFIEFVKESRR